MAVEETEAAELVRYAICPGSFETYSGGNTFLGDSYTALFFPARSILYMVPRVDTAQQVTASRSNAIIMSAPERERVKAHHQKGSHGDEIIADSDSNTAQGLMVRRQASYKG